MRCEYFPLFTHGCSKAQSECLAEVQQGSYTGCVPTASSSAIGSMYMRVHDTHTRVVYSLQ